MKRLVVLFATVLLLAGCSWVDILQGKVGENSATAADKLLKAAAWGVCPGSSTGAIYRRYNANQQETWGEYCNMERAKTGN